MKIATTGKLIALATLFCGFSASAINISAKGEGQVLLFPYYTVKNNTNTSFHISNSTNTAKAVKVRFREAKNGRSVLALNVYLSNQDIWTATLVKDGDGVKLITGDNSCTVPQIPSTGLAFSNDSYASSSDSSMARLQEGYVEVFEMGTVYDRDGSTAASDIAHTNGVPANCQNIVDAWESGGQWDTSSGTGMGGTTGNLSGVGYLINVSSGYQISFDATAIDNFWQNSDYTQHTSPLSPYPDLSGGYGELGDRFIALRGSKVSQIIRKDGTPLTSNWSNTVDALSAVLMSQSLSNDYNVYRGTASETDWVVTFPTKYLHLDSAFDKPPFISEYTENGACEQTTINYVGGESQVTAGVDFTPENPAVSGAELCWSTNRVTFNNSSLFGSGDVLSNLNVDEPAGRATMYFLLRVLVSEDSHYYSGLPFIGFAANVAKNGTLNNGSVLANYGASFKHVKKL